MVSKLSRLVVVLILLSITAFVSPTAVSAATAFVKLTQGNPTANTNTTSTANFTGSVTTGNLMVVWIWYQSGTASVTSVTDTGGNTYTKIIGPTRGTSAMAGWSQELWYAKNITGGSNFKVNANFSATFNAEKSIVAHEYSGADTVNPLDVSVGTAGTTANASSGSAVTTSPNELIFGGVLFQGNGTQGSGFTRRSSLQSNVTEDKNVTTAGSYTATVTNTAQAWIAQMATFRAAGSVPDTTVPTVSVTAPTNGSNVSGTVSVTATATDNIGVSGVQFYRDGLALGAEDTATPYNTSWDTLTTTNGAHSLLAVARDAAGNRATSTAVTVTVSNPVPDTTAPTAPTNLSAGAVSSSQINLAWTASTDNVGVTGYSVRRNGTPIATTTLTAYSDTGLAVSTLYSYAVLAFDAAGNQSALSSTVSTTTQGLPPDTQAPTVSISAPTNGSTVSGSITASATVSDNVGVAGVQFFLDGVTLGAEDIAAPHNASWNTTLSAAGAHTLFAVARDAAGNRATSTSVSVTVNNSLPPATPVFVKLAEANATVSSSSVSTANFTGSVTTGNLIAVWVWYNSNAASVTSVTDTAGNTYAKIVLTRGTGNMSGWSQELWYAKNVVGGTSFKVTATFSGTFGTEKSIAAHEYSGIDTTSPLDIFAGTAGTTANASSGTGLTTMPSELVFGGILFEGNGTQGSGFTRRSSLQSNVTEDKNVTTTGSYAATFTNVAQAWIAQMATFKAAGSVADTAAPVISNVSTSGIGQNSATVSFSTDEPSDTQVEYGLSTSYGSTTPLAASLVLSHSQSLSGLAADTVYHYRVKSKDAAGNLATSGDFSFTTATAVVDTVFPTVSITAPSSNATVSATTTVSATASDNVGVVGVQFQINGAPLGAEDTAAPYSFSWDTKQVANGAYTLTAVARDAANNTTTSAPVGINVLNTAGQSGFQNEILVTGLDFPDALEFLPDGSMLVTELTGKIKRVLSGANQALPTPFMTLTNIGHAGGLQGIFDIELDPNFATNRFFYVFYTLGTPNVDRLSRFTASADFTSASLGSEMVIYQDTQPSGTDHHGGAIVFGNDGKLYVSTGEHFLGFPSQDLSSSRGKILRYNADGTVPTDNPFYDGAGPNYDAIWAYGIRNPFRMTIDRPTGRIIFGDVGGNDNNTAREEVNILSRGANYSWPNCEGVCGSVDPGDPIYSYSHFIGSTGNTRDASITGGLIYRGSQFPAQYVGSYFFGDYVQNWIRRLTFDANNNVTGMQPFEPADGTTDGPYGAVVHMVVGPDGALYYNDLGWENESLITGGKIRRIKYNTGNLAPIVSATGTPLTGPSPLSVSFSTAGTSDPEGQPLTYIWDFGDSTSSTAANPTHVYPTSGQFTARVHVSDGVQTTVSNPITVKVGVPPVATILTPSTGGTFQAGDVISFSGDATDADDGSLPASAYSWQFLFHHNAHIHPTLPFTGIKSGTFTIPTDGHDFTGDTNYEIVLTVTDSNGLQDAKSVTIYPQKVNLTFDSAPVSGLTLKIDGVSRLASFVLDTLTNFHHTIEAPNQSFGASQYTFGSWSDGGSQTHLLTVPSVSQNMTATYTSTTTSLSVGLAGHLKFDEDTGSLTTADSSGNGWTANLFSSPAFVPGKFGNALNLNGVDQYAVVGDLDVSPVSVSMWIKQTAPISGWGSLVMKKLTYGFEVNGTTLNWSIGNGAVWNSVISSPVTVGTWQHFVGVYDGSTATLYRDGVQVGSHAATITSSDFPLLIGSWTGMSEFFNGALDDVRIYNRALTPAEVTQLNQL